MQKIDAHQHFWHYHPLKDAWITDEMTVIRRDFLPDDLLPPLRENQMNGCVAIQADQSRRETDFLIELSKTNSFIKGVVGWVDLQADDIAVQLSAYAEKPIVKGFRHILQAEADDFMLNDKFIRGISLLAKYNFTYDILINSGQLKYAEKLVSLFPKQRFVIDHLAKPKIKTNEIADWMRDMSAIARHQNVFCKVSGFCTEANWDNWLPIDVKPYLDVVFSAFGISRVMFGSDWPVNLLAGGYSKTVQCLKAYTAAFSVTDRDKFWGGNAVSFYHL